MKILLKILILFLFSTSLFSQTDSIKKKKLRPVLNPWFSTTLIDAHTSYLPKKGNLELIIHHRFTAIDNGILDMFGFFGASNIRLGLNYGITDKVMIGFGTEKDKNIQEFLIKYKILQQSRCGTMPISLVVFANMGINTRETDYWGAAYSFTNRLSYYSQIIVSRKWTSDFSTQIGLGFAHINKVDSYRIITEDSVAGTETVLYYPKYYNDAIGLSFVARYRISSTFTIIGEYEHPIAIKTKTNIVGDNAPVMSKPNLAMGFEITTMSHSFQLFASSYRGIVPQNNLIMNNFDFTQKDGIMLGFNVVVKF